MVDRFVIAIVLIIVLHVIQLNMKLNWMTGLLSPNLMALSSLLSKVFVSMNTPVKKNVYLVCLRPNASYNVA